MDSVALGASGLMVSKMCFGTLTLSPMQRNLDAKSASALICRAFDKGVNFLDTAELYDNYAAIAEALKYKRDAIVSTKCYAYDKKTALESFEKALRELGRDYIDIFMLHEQESQHTLRGHMEALEFFAEKKSQGYIRALGVSTHYVECARAIPDFNRRHSNVIEVIHPIFNARGIGIVDGSIEDMREALRACRQSGVGIFAMKPLGGGHLIEDRSKALKFVLDEPILDSIAIGMQSAAEVDYNCAVFSGEDPSQYASRIELQNRTLHIDYWCEGCGNCARACQQGALSIVGGKARVDHGRCALCGYCAAKCLQFCIKVI